MRINNLFSTIGHRIGNVNYRDGIKFAYGKVEDGIAFTYRNSKRAIKNPWVQAITATTVGAATAYNIIKDGFAKGRRETINDTADGYVNLFAESRSAPYESNLLEKARYKVREFKFNSRLYPAYHKVKNNIKSIFGETLDYGLNIAAITGVAYGLLSNRTNSIVKKYIPAISTAYLLFISAKTAIVDVLGFGKKPM